MTTQAMAMKVAHAILTIETQGITQFLDYSSRINHEAQTAPNLSFSYPVQRLHPANRTKTAERPV